jgi:hypothetical protein
MFHFRGLGGKGGLGLWIRNSIFDPLTVEIFGVAALFQKLFFQSALLLVEQKFGASDEIDHQVD